MTRVTQASAMRRVARLLRCGAFALLLTSGAARATERILATDIEVRVHDDGQLDITERIHVRAEGRQIRHGITRDVPTRDRDRTGHRILAAMDVIEVLRDGEPEPWEVEHTGDGVRITIGDTRFLPAPSEPVYTLRYRITRQVGFFADHDALDWNAIGTDRAFPVERASVRVSLPAAVPIAAMQATAFTGVPGATGRDYHVALSASGSARWTLTRALAPDEGLTIMLAFPKGLVSAPSPRQAFLWRLHDHRGLLIAAGGLLLLLGYCLLRWRRLGRTPDTGTFVIRHAPPPGFSPGGLRYLRRRHYDGRCLSADLLACAVDDHVHITREKTADNTGWRLARTRAGANTLPTMEQRALLTTLLPDAHDGIALVRAQAARIRNTKQAHAAALRRRFQPAMFRLNGVSLLIALAIALITGGAAIAIAATTVALPATLGLVGLMLPVLLVFALLAKTPTLEGRALLDQIEGLRRYLSSAANHEIAQRASPDGQLPVIDAARYEFLLPYAVALDVEHAWTKAFTAAAGVIPAGNAVAGFAWYAGIPVIDMGKFARSMGHSLSARIAASSTPSGRRRRVRHADVTGSEGDGS